MYGTGGSRDGKEVSCQWERKDMQVVWHASRLMRFCFSRLHKLGKVPKRAKRRWLKGEWTGEEGVHDVYAHMQAGSKPDRPTGLDSELRNWAPG